MPVQLTNVFLRSVGTSLIAAILLSACATNRGLPPAPASIESPATRYKMGPLDVLNVVVWRNPEVSGAMTVRPDGYVTMPLIGDLMAAGKTPTALSDEIRMALSKMVREPSVTVVVMQANNLDADQVRIIGETLKPQSVLYRRDMSLLDLVLMAGGLTINADGNNAVLIRGSEGGKKYSVRVKDLTKGGDMSANVPVIPGDIVSIPQSLF